MWRITSTKWSSHHPALVINSKRLGDASVRVLVAACYHAQSTKFRTGHRRVVAQAASTLLKATETQVAIWKQRHELHVPRPRYD